MFDDLGHPIDEIEEKLKEETLEGNEAWAFLSMLFAGTTHGNYDPEIMFRRLAYGRKAYHVTISKKGFYVDYSP